MSNSGACWIFFSRLIIAPKWVIDESAKSAGHSHHLTLTCDTKTIMLLLHVPRYVRALLFLNTFQSCGDDFRN